MNDSNNQFPKYGFAAYNAPKSYSARRSGIIEKVFGPSIAAKLRNPIIATGALLLVGVAFAGIILVSYPDGDEAENVPVIKAETTAFKDTPDTPGGMTVPFQDSTIFMSMQGEGLDEKPPVENLLADEEPVDRFAMFEAQDAAEEAAAEAKAAAEASQTEPASGTEDSGTSSTENTAAPPVKTEETAEAAPTPTEKPFEIKKLDQKVEKIPGKDLMAEAEAKAQTQAELKTPQKPSEIHAAGESPETLAFVRSVLDQKDAEKAYQAPATNTASAPTAEELAGIAPAAGSVAGGAIAPGEYFVQLASVTSEAGATSEWGKLEKSYDGLLQNVSYRVERADLDKGTFYRIQAGPMSKDSANRLCDSIKAQKPGGCLVVK